MNLSPAHPIFWHPLQQEVIYTPAMQWAEYQTSKSYINGQEPPQEKKETSLVISVICKFLPQICEYYGIPAGTYNS